MWAYPAEKDDASQISKLVDLYTNPPPGPGNLVRRNQIKVYQDGIIGTRTALVKNPYLIDFPDYGIGWLRPQYHARYLDIYDYRHIIGNRGMHYFTKDRLSQYIGSLQRGVNDKGEGYDFMVHVVGDRATNEVLTAVSENPNPDVRHRATHIEIVDPADYGRFKTLNVIADGQVAGK